MNKIFTKIATACAGLAMAIGVGVAIGNNANVVSTKVSAYTGSFVKTNITDLVAGDLIVIANNNSKAMSNDKGTGAAPSAVAVTITSNTITDPADKLIWTFGKKDNNYTFLAGTSGSNYLYCTDANNGLRVGTNTNNTFTIDSGYLKNVATSRYVGVYNNSDWRCYTGSGGNIANQTFGFYKLNASVVVSDWELTTGSLTITGTLTNSVYYQNDTEVASLDGLTVTANYWSASKHETTKTQVVTNSVTSTLDLQNERIVVSYTEGGKTQTGYVSITVKNENRPLYGEMSTFSAVSGYVTGTNNNISYAAAKGGAGTVPAVNGGEIRVYQNGGLFTVSSSKDTKITEIVLGSAMGTTVSYSIDGGEASSNKSIAAYETLTVEDLDASSVVFTCKGTTSSTRLYVNYLKVSYKEVEEVTPTKATVSFKTDKGTYYNGGAASNGVFSTNDITVVTKDDSGNVADTLSSGKGFIVTIGNFDPIDATTEAKTFSLAGKAAGQYTISVVVPGVGANDSNVDNSNQSPALAITVIAKAPSSYEWMTDPTTVYYAHRDSFALDGALKIHYNDNSYQTSMANYNHKFHAFDENAENNAGAEVELPVHQNGTLNVDSETKYVVEVWHKDYSTGLHEFYTITVKVPTLTIVDNYQGNYYVGATRNMDVTVTVTFEENNSRVLTDSEYTLSHNSVTPANTNPISVTASWVIDETVVMTSSALVINPTVSTRVLNELAISDVTLSAGSNFVISSEILLDVTENDVNDYEVIEQAAVTFVTENDEVLTSNTRLKKSHTGTVTATYSEGSGTGKTVTTTFALTVTNAVVSTMSTTEGYVYNKITSTDDLTDGNYLIVYEDASVAFDGNLDTLDATSNYVDVVIDNDKIVGDSTINAATFAWNSTAKTLQSASGYYIGASSNSNGLKQSEEADTYTNTITFDDDGNVSIKANFNGSTMIMAYNSNAGQNRFRYFKATGQKLIQLYKQATETIYSGDKVAYLKSVIDAYRLNSATEGSICNADSGLFASSDWTLAKQMYAALSLAEKAELSSTQDYFGETGKSYNDTFVMLLAMEQAANARNGMLSFGNSTDNEMLTVIVVMSVLATICAGGFFFYRRRKEQQ